MIANQRVLCVYACVYMRRCVRVYVSASPFLPFHLTFQQYAIELDARKPQLDKLAIETEGLGEDLRVTDNTSTGQLSAMGRSSRSSLLSFAVSLPARSTFISLV